MLGQRYLQDREPEFSNRLDDDRELFQIEWLGDIAVGGDTQLLESTTIPCLGYPSDSRHRPLEQELVFGVKMFSVWTGHPAALRNYRADSLAGQTPTVSDHSAKCFDGSRKIKRPGITVPERMMLWFRGECRVQLFGIFPGDLGRSPFLTFIGHVQPGIPGPSPLQIVLDVEMEGSQTFNL